LHDYVAAHGGEAVFGKPISGVHGEVGQPGSVVQEYEFAHLFLNRATNQVEAQMKDRTNPQGFKVGPGIYGKCKEHGLKLITNEMWFSPDPGQPGLGKMSRAWAQDAKGVTVVIMASEQPELGKAWAGYALEGGSLRTVVIKGKRLGLERSFMNRE
jgi:hypothetical protein